MTETSTTTRVLANLSQRVEDHRLDDDDHGIAGTYIFDLPSAAIAAHAGDAAEAARTWFHERQPIAVLEHFDLDIEVAPRDRDIPIEDLRFLPEPAFARL